MASRCAMAEDARIESVDSALELLENAQVAEYEEGAGQAGATGPDQRERMASLLTSALERGLMDEAEYLRRLEAINMAASFEEMARIVQEMPVFGAGGTTSAGLWAQGGSKDTGSASAPPWRGGPDPVDLALLARSKPGARPKADHRWTAMLMVILLFVMLMILGLVLASRVRPSPSGAPLTPLTPAPIVAPGR